MSRCTECSCEMLDSDARLYDECPSCRQKRTPHAIPRFAATGRRRLRMPGYFRPPRWEVVDAYAAVQGDE